MKKVTVIGDVHGRDDWKQQVNSRHINVFVGDYFDSFDIPPIQQIDNFNDILRFAEHNDVVLLIGNHDYHYMINLERYSGYNLETQSLIPNLYSLMEKGRLQWVYEYDEYIFSHAGLSNTWMEKHNLHSVDEVNKYLSEDPRRARFDGVDMSGDDVTQGPLWIRPNSLRADQWSDKVQDVGHTIMDDLLIEDYTIFVDTNNKYHLTLE